MNPKLSDLRKAARDMYEALKQICDSGSLLRDDCLPEGLSEKIDKALAKAEGKEV